MPSASPQRILIVHGDSGFSGNRPGWRPAAPGQILPDHSIPGHSIDALRTQGKPAEARAEFERLIGEGADSGIDSRQPAAIFDSVRAEIRNRAITPVSDTATEASGTVGTEG